LTSAPCCANKLRSLLPLPAKRGEGRGEGIN
jgi:hypothetical protein